MIPLQVLGNLSRGILLSLGHILKVQVYNSIRGRLAAKISKDPTVPNYLVVQTVGKKFYPFLEKDH